MTEKGVGSSSQHQHVQLALSMAQSNFNAIVSLAVLLVRAELLTADGIETLLKTMSEPLDLPSLADRPLIAMHQARIDGLLGEIGKHLAGRSPPKRA